MFQLNSILSIQAVLGNSENSYSVYIEVYKCSELTITKM